MINKVIKCWWMSRKPVFIIDPSNPANGQSKSRLFRRPAEKQVPVSCRGKSIRSFLCAFLVLVTVADNALSAKRDKERTSRRSANYETSESGGFLTSIDAWGPYELASPLDEYTLRRSIVKVNLSRIIDNSTDTGASSIKIELFDDVRFRAYQQRFENREASSYTWFGNVPDDPFSDVIMTVVNGKLAGAILLHGKLYRIKALVSGNYAVTEVDQDSFPDRGDDGIYVGSSQTSSITAGILDADAVDIPLCSDKVATCVVYEEDGSRIDVLVAYTDAAEQAAGDIEAEIHCAVDAVNKSFRSSGIKTELNLVHTMKVDYTETDDIERDLRRLKDTSEGHMDEIHPARERYAADIVSLFVGECTGGYCGWAYTMGKGADDFASRAFNVVAVPAVVDNWAFAHEIGHNMGALHDRDTGSNGEPIFDFSYGFIDKRGFRSLMATRVGCDSLGIKCDGYPFWSNPDIQATWNGEPVWLGNPESDPEPTNNAKTLNFTRQLVANFRIAPDAGDDSQYSAPPDSDYDGLSITVDPDQYEDTQLATDTGSNTSLSGGTDTEIDPGSGDGTGDTSGSLYGNFSNSTIGTDSQYLQY